jgi:hypothetical protein
MKKVKYLLLDESSVVPGNGSMPASASVSASASTTISIASTSRLNMLCHKTTSDTRNITKNIIYNNYYKNIDGTIYEKSSELHLNHIFGIETSCQSDCIHFLSNKTCIYVAGCYLILLNIETFNQTILPFK